MLEVNKTVFVDMDNTLFDFDGAATKALPEVIRDQYGQGQEFYVASRFPEEFQQIIKNTYNHPDFFANLELLPGALDAWEVMLDHGYEPQILSSPLSSNPNAVGGKLESLRKHFARRFGERVITSAIIDKAKWNYPGLALIDDRINPAQGNTASWQHVLFSRQHNIGNDHQPRLESWIDPEENLIPLLDTLGLCEPREK